MTLESQDKPACLAQRLDVAHRQPCTNAADHQRFNGSARTSLGPLGNSLGERLRGLADLRDRKLTLRGLHRARTDPYTGGRVSATNAVGDGAEFVVESLRGHDLRRAPGLHPSPRQARRP